jgi:chromosome partitioning protein
MSNALMLNDVVSYHMMCTDIAKGENMKILFGSYKGGPGKTTTAINVAILLAMQGRDVLMVDCDKQASALSWAGIRTKAGLTPAITCVSAYGDSVHQEIDRLAQKFDDVIIDTAGHDSVELRAAMLTADVLVSPVEVCLFDMLTLGFMRDIISRARIYNPKLKCYLVPNKLSGHPSRATGQRLRMAATAENIPEYIVADSGLVSRVVFQDIPETGKTVVEAGDWKAAQEMKCLFQEIYHG